MLGIFVYHVQSEYLNTYAVYILLINALLSCQILVLNNMTKCYLPKNRLYNYITQILYNSGVQLYLSHIILRSNVLHYHFYLPKVIIQVHNGNGVLNRLVTCLKCMELLNLLSTPGQFGPVLLS